MFEDSLIKELLDQSIDRPNSQRTLTIHHLRVGAAVRRQFKNRVVNFVSVSSWREDKYLLSSDFYDLKVTASPARLLEFIDWMEGLLG